MLNYKSSPRPIANTFSKKIPRKTNLGRKAMGQLSDQVIILPLAGASLLAGAVQFSHRAYKVSRNMLKLFDSCAKNKQLFFSRSFSLRSNALGRNRTSISAFAPMNALNAPGRS